MPAGFQRKARKQAEKKQGTDADAAGKQKTGPDKTPGKGMKISFCKGKSFVLCLCHGHCIKRAVSAAPMVKTGRQVKIKQMFNITKSKAVLINWKNGAFKFNFIGVIPPVLIKQSFIMEISMY